MSKRKEFIYRWRIDYDFNTVISAFGSLLVTTVFALYNGFIGISHSSLWHGAICVYYIILVIFRGMIVLARRKISFSQNSEKARNKVYMVAAVLLMILNFSLIIPVSLMVRQQKPVNLSLIPAISMAVYTTYKIIMASINLKRRKNSADSLIRLLRTINFIDALVSILTLQNTLIMVNSKTSSITMTRLATITGASVLLIILFLSVGAIKKGVMNIRKSE
ncbi:MAG: hypothetical protein IJT84_07890 [Clostridia bacterium]|nr:hypothetical protein [Clostridia bacterium]